MKKRINKNGIFYVVISLVAVLGIGLGIRAYSTMQTQNIETYNYYEAVGQPLQENITVGAFPGPDVYGDIFVHDHLISGFAIDEPFVIPATTTLNVATNGRDLIASVASYTNNTGKTLECDTVRMTILTSSDTWVYSYGTGTTTKITNSPSWTNTTTVGLIASTTATALNDVTADGFNLFTNEGSNAGSYYSQDDKTATSTAFLLNNGVSILGYIKSINATSSNSFVKGSGHNLTGALQANCHFFTSN